MPGTTRKLTDHRAFVRYRCVFSDGTERASLHGPVGDARPRIPTRAGTKGGLGNFQRHRGALAPSHSLMVSRVDEQGEASV